VAKEQRRKAPRRGVKRRENKKMKGKERVKKFRR